MWFFFEVTNPNLNRSLFDCGIAELNDYLQRYARQNHNKGIAKTWVMVNENNPEIPVGYYSLSMAELQRESLSDELKKGFPRYPLPVIRIGKLAVDKQLQGQQLGELLLIDIFKRGIKIYQDIGVVGFLVNAINERAKDFYLKYNFSPSVDSPLSLFLPMKIVLALIRSDSMNRIILTAFGLLFASTLIDSTFHGAIMVQKAEAVVGRPLTPVSGAGVARRWSYLLSTL